MRKYSDFIRYPILFGEKTLNSQVPLWQKNKKDIKKDIKVEKKETKSNMATFAFCSFSIPSFPINNSVLEN